MAETKKQTYSMYGKDYDFEDLQRKADAGLNQYISTLKRGYKDQDKFRQAYYNLMSGIQDGTITFQNGQYVVSTGRYTNSETKKKDYYGLMANYIYNQQKRGKLYTPPEDDSKIKWGTHTLANQIKLGLLGNSDKICACIYKLKGSVTVGIDLCLVNEDKNISAGIVSVDLSGLAGIALVELCCK